MIKPSTKELAMHFVEDPMHMSNADEALAGFNAMLAVKNEKDYNLDEDAKILDNPFYMLIRSGFPRWKVEQMICSNY